MASRIDPRLHFPWFGVWANHREHRTMIISIAVSYKK